MANSHLWFSWENQTNQLDGVLQLLKTQSGAKCSSLRNGTIRWQRPARLLCKFKERHSDWFHLRECKKKIANQHFLWTEPQCWVKNGVVQWSKSMRCAYGGFLKSWRARTCERTSPQNFYIFCTRRGSNLKLFSEITLHWNFDDFLLKLDFVYHVSGVPLCFCGERSKIFLIQKDF